MPDEIIARSPHRSAWRALIVIALMVASLNFLLTVVLFVKVQENRVSAIEQTCLAIEDLKSDVRNTLNGFHTPINRLPKHADGTRAFQPISISCKELAEKLVSPPKEN
jgi:hypothetical protein